LFVIHQPHDGCVVMSNPDDPPAPLGLSLSGQMLYVQGMAGWMSINRCPPKKIVPLRIHLCA
jgi:hypothetical protein